MNSLELLIVTRRFWPHSGLTELGLLQLARNFLDAGHRVTVATFKWERNWSDYISLNDIPVFRFARPVSGPWTSFRYSRSLMRHFSKQHYDAVIVSGIGDEAIAVNNGLDELTPMLLYVDDSFVGVNNKIHRKHVETCLGADGLIANSQTVKDQLDEIEGMPAATVVHPGFSNNRNRIVDKNAIRAALAKTHPVVRVEKDQKLAISFTKMHSDDGLIDLINAWPSVLAKFPGAKLWLLGEGRNASRIWQRIVDLDLAYSVIFPGYFDDLSEILTAADLYVHPAGPQQSADGLIAAQAAGVACLAVTNGVTRELVDNNVNGWLLDDNNPATLGRAIVDALSNPESCRALGITAKETLSDNYSPAMQVNRFVELITNCSSQLVEVAK